MVDESVGRWRIKVAVDVVRGLVGSKRLIMPDKLQGIGQSEIVTD
jgi:hypothetical protein